MNDEIRMTECDWTRRLATREFVICVSSFFRHWSLVFVIFHLYEIVHPCCGAIELGCFCRGREKTGEDSYEFIKRSRSD